MPTFLLKTPGFIRLEKAFARWLKTLNYNPQAVYAYPLSLREFFYWLEQNQISSLSEVSRQATESYFKYLSERENRRKGGRLSKSTLQGHITTLRIFTHYLRETGQESFEVNHEIKNPRIKVNAILSREEIGQLYKTCTDSLLDERDKAMLSIYYGCGLRRNEGVNLDVNDILFDKNLVYVRKGKNYKERYVPLSTGVKENLQEYINHIRPMFIKVPCTALFLGLTGKRLSGIAMTSRFRKLKERAEISKPGGLHLLRHSIATHLLRSGMGLEQIRQFLGHGSLGSTQVYTHLSQENQ